MFSVSLKRVVTGKWLAPAVLTLLVLPAVVSQAQTAEKLEKILTAKEMTYGDTALFVLAAVDQAGSGANTPEAAFNRARELDWLPPYSAATDSARLDGVALLLMKAFELKGGLFYTLFPTAHYAYRELVHRTVIQNHVDPMMRVSGNQFLYMLSRVSHISNQEGAK